MGIFGVMPYLVSQRTREIGVPASARRDSSKAGGPACYVPAQRRDAVDSIIAAAGGVERRAVTATPDLLGKLDDEGYVPLYRRAVRAIGRSWPDDVARTLGGCVNINEWNALTSGQSRRYDPRVQGPNRTRLDARHPRVALRTGANS